LVCQLAQRLFIYEGVRLEPATAPLIDEGRPCGLTAFPRADEILLASRDVVASGIAGHAHLSAARMSSNKGPIMELMEAISGRRSIRDYRPDPVAREAITRLIDAAIQAPSAMNQQPWSFVVIQKQSLLDRISHDAKAHLMSERPVAGLPAHLYERLTNANFQLFYHAPVLIVISLLRKAHG
jgi:hypothetical protein